MAPRSFALATALVLGLTGLAQAQARTTWQEPERSPAAAAPAGPQARTREAQAVPPREPAPAPREAPAAKEAPAAAAREPAAAAQPRARARSERRREVRSARYRGGSGATWKTGRDSHGFAGSFGGCRFRGSAGPNGYRLDRSC